MRLATLRAGGELHPALWLAGELLDLRAAGSEIPAAAALGTSVRQILASAAGASDALERVAAQVGASRELAERLRLKGALVDAGTAELAPAIPDPGMILAAGMNYYAHLKEMNTPIPTTPYAFTKNLASLVGSGQSIELPRGHDEMVDWEGEFCAVIGKPCYRVDTADALKYVGGYTLLNDVSARDWVNPVFASTGIMGPIAAWEQNLLGKQYPTFCPLGPAIVTADEIPDPRNVRIQTRLNGEVMQDAHTSDLVFGVAELIGYYSYFYAFQPGDVISTGSPSGVGFARKPQVFMHAGDNVTVESEKIGTLLSPVATC